jgi:cytochrome c oxidase subunit 2
MKSIAVVLPVLALAGCTRIAVFNPAGPAADHLSSLTLFISILFLAIALVMWALIALVASRPRGSFAEHAPVDIGGGHGWVLIGGFLIPAAILAVVFITGLSAMSKFPLHDGMLMPADIVLTGHQWWWEVKYKDGPLDQEVTTANEIHIPAGRPVDIDLTSVDVIHSFWVPTLHGKVDLIPSMRNRIRIEAAQPGVYRGQCAEYCGAEHAHMILYVVADTPEQYQRWLADQRKPGAAPQDDQQTHGQQLFMNGPCSNCHTIAGTLAQGKVGPDLTHIGSRRAIAANMLENNPANLEAWITHAQALKPAVAMPNITQFNGEESRALVAYLRSLK